MKNMPPFTAWTLLNLLVVLGCAGGARSWYLDDAMARWLQCVLGTLTAGCYFFFARRAFQSTAIAMLTGLLIAFYPFWIVNTAELNDGALASFALSICLMLGTRGGQEGGA